MTPKFVSYMDVSDNNRFLKTLLPRKYKCGTCNKTFPTYQALTMGNKMHHLHIPQLLRKKAKPLALPSMPSRWCKNPTSAGSATRASPRVSLLGATRQLTGRSQPN
ncbi:hypothetical protein CK203_117667 [Vitis vinifera]|uniref:C2H2-type domain-containing protein n=1 Tax=Vitis vinifera TaxID=29760 RepID=A0A438CR90_VITVI|nr:hypothetical protein CK203_117667 [Vitis vinifera]